MKNRDIDITGLSVEAALAKARLLLIAQIRQQEVLSLKSFTDGGVDSDEAMAAIACWRSEALEQIEEHLLEVRAWLESEAQARTVH